MTLRLTPDCLAAAYDFLSETDPFIKWGMPASEDVTFKVVRTTRWHGDCNHTAGKFVLRCSQGTNGHTMTLLGTLAHEMIHIRQFLLKDSGSHNALFDRLAKQVCKHHGFDIRAF
jgi:SprT-like family.